jgi:CubicO group peptidase (beta-lactamase class C family)
MQEIDTEEKHMKIRSTSFLAVSLLFAGLFSGIASSAIAEEAAYEWEYGYQMGTRAPDVKDLTDAMRTAHDGAVYANRNASEFATSVWNFAPSETPLRFVEGASPLSHAVLAHLQRTNTDGYIVVKDGVILHEYYAKGMHPTTKHNVHSVGKSWTSAVWGDALLGVMDKTASDIVPELKGTILADQTVRHVVDMRTPVYWYEDYNDPNSPVVISGAAMGWDYKSIDLDLVSFLKSLKKNPELEAGDWYYVSANTMLMGLLGSRVSGLHQYEGLRQFYNALGLEHISGTVANLHGEYAAEGGQFFTLRDYVKLPQAMAAGGIVDGRRVIAEDYIADVFTADAEKAAAWKNGPYASALPGFKHYSNQWYVVDEDIAFGIGSYGAYIAFNRESKVAIAKVSTYPVNPDFEMAGRDLPWLMEQIRTYPGSENNP